MKRKESICAIVGSPLSGPIFGDDIIFLEQIFKENSYYIHNNGEGTYECHPEHRSSLFVNTAGPDEENYCSVLDYEVYTHN